MNRKKKGKKQNRDIAVRTYAARVRKMTDEQIWNEGHPQPTLELTEGVAKELYEDILAVLAPRFEDDTMEEIARTLGNWYGTDPVIKLVDAHKAENDARLTEADDRLPLPGKIFRHFKGNYFKVLHIAMDSATKRPMVIYQSLETDNAEWVFSKFKTDFLAEVNHEKFPDATQKWVFQCVKEKE